AAATTTAATARDAGDLVARVRLLARLRAGPRASTLVAAPAGYGKTALVGQWAAEHRGPVTWLTPRPDERPADVTARVAAALHALDGAAGTLVVDGLDAPDDATAVPALVDSLVRLPPTVRLLVTARAGPPE